MPTLPNNPTLQDFQKYITEMVKERGFGNETVPELFSTTTAVLVL